MSEIMNKTAKDKYGYLMEESSNQLRNQWIGKLTELSKNLDIKLEEGDYEYVVFEKAGEERQTLSDIADRPEAERDLIYDMAELLMDDWNVVMIHPEKRTRHILDFDDKGMPEGVRESVEEYDLNVRFEKQANSPQGSRVWGRAFRTYMLQNDIDLNDHRCLSCIAFQKDGAFVSFENISRQEAYNDEGIGRYVLNYLAQGWDLHFFRPGETTPHSLVYDEETLPVAYGEHREPAPKPVEPQKPSRWVRFANWITRGKAYSAEVTAYENSAERYPDELAAWERDWGSEVALRSYRKDKLETAAEKENSYTEKLRLRQARKENAEEKKRADEMNKLIDHTYDTYIKEKETDEEYSIREEITLDAMPNPSPKMNQRLHKITQKVDREQLKKEVEKSKQQSSL